MLTGKQKRYLRSQAMTMKPLINLGKNGVTETFIEGVKAAIEARELIKISLLPATDETPKAVGQALVAAIPGLSVAQTIGRTVVVYKRAFDPENRKLSAIIAKL
ncbi:YhbY family RNA-binding protein [Lacticaseibacillus baoqingensis]|uniref:YhbY family RNA-binding protein n=1 Tax=Lacticaseibacillus baoqingensis TaxID=2486013 RepID=A0ABW4E440_9LACO|nr:YhbY family RNA-binding protein [Lacticaseibacillus baoqingensis]